MQAVHCSSKRVVMMPEDDWICLDEGMKGLGCGVTSDWERMKVSSGSSSSKLLVVGQWRWWRQVGLVAGEGEEWW